MGGNSWFSEDYPTARERFRELAMAAGAHREDLVLDAEGASGEELSIEIAWLGSRRPENVLLHTSGLHGVEGFVGSAIQLDLLNNPPPMGPDEALILVHVINPYGMSWLRRVNENNVDLNRNFLIDESHVPPADEMLTQERETLQTYCLINHIINPNKPVSGLADALGFRFRAMRKILRYGLYQIRQAIAYGQHYLPFGLFYGGLRLEQGPQLLLDWFARHLQGVPRGAVVDVHTGLGKFSQEALLTFYDGASDKYRTLKDALGERVEQLSTGTTAFAARGFMVKALEEHLLGPQWTTVTQEFGTYPSVSMLKALRDENAWHLYGDRSNLQHPAKTRFRESFCPASAKWREQILRRGRLTVEDVMSKLLRSRTAVSL